MGYTTQLCRQTFNYSIPSENVCYLSRNERSSDQQPKSDLQEALEEMQKCTLFQVPWLLHMLKHHDTMQAKKLMVSYMTLIGFSHIWSGDGLKFVSSVSLPYKVGATIILVPIAQQQ